ncbi:hypothetical protein ABIB85_004168 [Bradyrhizobium sp. JR1.5]|uniref:hypothetical protein n=1 Tax=unclassified Bradyrhizobium TaxID=2631580 RepID=UPI00339250E5
MIGTLPGSAMTAPLLNVIFEVIDFALDCSVAVDDTKWRSKPEIVEGPLPPAAQRALAEAEERQRVREQTGGETIQTS